MTFDEFFEEAKRLEGTGVPVIPLLIGALREIEFNQTAFVECNYCHITETIKLEVGESAKGGIECQVCERGHLFPTEKPNA